MTRHAVCWLSQRPRTHLQDLAGGVVAPDSLVDRLQLIAFPSEREQALCHADQQGKVRQVLASKHGNDKGGSSSSCDTNVSKGECAPNLEHLQLGRCLGRRAAVQGGKATEQSQLQPASPTREEFGGSESESESES